MMQDSDFYPAVRAFDEAAQRLAQLKPSWATYFDQVLGVDGLLYRMFPDRGDRVRFEATATYNLALSNLARLRGVKPAENDSAERVITVRVPKAMHQTLLAEAKERDTSLNKLCISKLLQAISPVDETIRPDSGGRCQSDQVPTTGGAD